MKKIYPILAVVILLVGAYYVWKNYSGSGPSGYLPGFRNSSTPASASAGKQLEWPTVDKSDAGFTLRMPSEPHQVVVQAANEAGGTEPVNMLVTGNSSETTYAVAWADKPPVERVNGFSPDKTLDQARDGAMGRTQTSMVNETRVNPQGYPGREFVARNVGGGYLETRFIMAGTRLYMLIAVSPSATARHDEEIARFFNSFTVASDQKVPETLPAATR
jgi:hypothetical protein